MKSLRSILLFSVIFGQFSVLAEDWTEFRGPTGQGISTHQDLPLDWTESKNVIWKTDLPGKGWSSPVVSGGNIYLTMAVPVGEETINKTGTNKVRVNNAYSLRTICLDEASGEIIWNEEISKVPPRIGIHPKNSHASPTPLIRGNRIYVHFGTYGTAALDLEGNTIWKKQIEYKPVHGSGGSPVLFEDLLIFHCDGGDDAFVIALDTKTGEERWRTKRQDHGKRTFSFSTPLIVRLDDESTLVSPASNAVYGYDPNSGKQKWVVRYPNKWSIVPRPVFAAGLILVCTGYEGPAELLAIRPGGKGDVTDTHVAWRVDKFVPHNPSPIVSDGNIYLISDSGIASCRDLATGKLHWKKRMGDDFSASPFLAQQRIYFLSEEGACTVIRANPSAYEQLAESDLKQRTLASMVPMDRSILLRTESSLYRLGAR